MRVGRFWTCSEFTWRVEGFGSLEGRLLRLAGGAIKRKIVLLCGIFCREENGGREGRLGGVEDLICLEVRGKEWCCRG